MWTRLVLFFVGRGLGGWIVEGLLLVKEEDGELVVDGGCWW